MQTKGGWHPCCLVGVDGRNDSWMKDEWSFWISSKRLIQEELSALLILVILFFAFQSQTNKEKFLQCAERAMRKFQNQTQANLHKCHLVCLVARLHKLNGICNDSYVKVLLTFICAKEHLIWMFTYQFIHISCHFILSSLTFSSFYFFSLPILSFFIFHLITNLSLSVLLFFFQNFQGELLFCHFLMVNIVKIASKWRI